MIEISLQDCLKDVIDNRGVTPKKRGTEWQDSGIPVLSANNVKTSGLQKLDEIRYISEDIYPLWMKTPLEKGDIILTSEAPAGEVFYWDSDEKVILGQRLYGLKVKDEINSKYLKYYLQSSIGQKAIQGQNSGSTVFGIAASTFPYIAVKLLEREDQDSVARLLYSIDSKISLNNSICTDLENMAKLLYDYWFVQFDFPDENGKPYKSSGGKMVWNDELKREIPEGWKAKKVGELLGIYPKTNSIISEKYNDGDIFPIIDQSRDYICGYTDDANKVLNIDDAIVFGDHTNYAKYVNFPFARGADGTQIIISNDKSIPNYLLYLQIIALPVIEQGYSRHFKFLKEQLVIVPRQEIAESFISAVISSLETTKNKIFENKQLTSLRDFLLPMLMNGQVKIKEAV